MTRRTYPVFDAHERASCFNCEGDFDGSFPFRSGYAPGNGQWFQCCEKCGMQTWYDLKVQNENEVHV